MAEGFLRNMLGNQHKVFSAGIETHGVNPRAIASMKEVDIDISNHTSNHVDEYSEVDFDHIITVCDHARENCPYIPSQAKRFHHDFPDPAKAVGNETEIMTSFRHTRNLIDEYLKDFVSKQQL